MKLSGSFSRHYGHRKPVIHDTLISGRNSRPQDEDGKASRAATGRLPTRQESGQTNESLQMQTMSRRTFMRVTPIAGGGLLFGAIRAPAPIMWGEAGISCAVLVLVAAAGAGIAISHFCKKKYLVAWKQEDKSEPMVFDCLDCMPEVKLNQMDYHGCLGTYTNRKQCEYDAAQLTAYAKTNSFPAIPCAPIMGRDGRKLTLNHSTNMKDWSEVASTTTTPSSRGWLVMSPETRSHLTDAQAIDLENQGATLVSHNFGQVGFFQETEAA